MIKKTEQRSGSKINMDEYTNGKYNVQKNRVKYVVYWYEDSLLSLLVLL